MLGKLISVKCLYICNIDIKLLTEKILKNFFIIRKDCLIYIFIL